MTDQELLARYKERNLHIRGWFDIRFLDELFGLNKIHEQKNIRGNILEIGTYQGKSFIPLSFLLRNDEQIVGVDTFSIKQNINDGIYFNPITSIKNNLKQIYKENIKNLNHKLRRADSKNLKSYDYLKYLDNNLNYRIISIDANHSYEYVRHDLEQSKDIIMKGGYIICDDYGLSEFPDVKKAADDFLLENNNFKVKSHIYYRLVIVKDF